MKIRLFGDSEPFLRFPFNPLGQSRHVVKIAKTYRFLLFEIISNEIKSDGDV